MFFEQTTNRSRGHRSSIVLERERARRRPPRPALGRPTAPRSLPLFLTACFLCPKPLGPQLPQGRGELPLPGGECLAVAPRADPRRVGGPAGGLADGARRRCPVVDRAGQAAEDVADVAPAVAEASQRHHPVPDERRNIVLDNIFFG